MSSGKIMSLNVKKLPIRPLPYKAYNSRNKEFFFNLKTDLDSTKIWWMMTDFFFEKAFSFFLIKKLKKYIAFFNIFSGTRPENVH